MELAASILWTGKQAKGDEYVLDSVEVCSGLNLNINDFCRYTCFDMDRAKQRKGVIGLSLQ